MAGALLLAASFSSLVALRSVEVDEIGVDVPVAARIWMADAKHAFRNRAGELLNQGIEQPACVEEALLAELADQSIPAECGVRQLAAALGSDGMPSQSKGCRYGELARLEVEGFDDLVAVRVGISIPYDVDSALYLFRRGEDGWRLVFQREENDYESIGKALGSFDWRVSPRGTDGAFLVLTSAITPSPASSWQMLTYTVDRVLPWCDEPVAIARDTVEIYLGWNEPELRVTPDHYGLRFTAGGLEPGFTRARWLEYDVEGDQPVRVDPIAGTATAFLEEWLEMPEEEARRWSDVEPEVPAGDDWTWGQDRQCADGAWQLRIDASDGAVYYIVSDEGMRYRVQEIRDDPRPGCPDERVSEPDAKGAVLILDTVRSPLPNPDFETLEYTVSRRLPGAEPVQIAGGSETIFFAGVDLHVTPSGFGMRFGVIDETDPGRMRGRSLEYALDRLDRPIRVDPLAGAPSSFVLEWLELPEEEAWRWSDVTRPKPSADPPSWCAPVGRCIDGSWQVCLDDRYYIVAEPEKERYRVREIRDEARPDCEDVNPL